jgi:hypothetical protein
MASMESITNPTQEYTRTRTSRSGSLRSTRSIIPRALFSYEAIYISEYALALVIIICRISSEYLSG